MEGYAENLEILMECYLLRLSMLSWHTWIIDNVRQVRIKSMFETISRTRCGTLNKFC